MQVGGHSFGLFAGFNIQVRLYRTRHCSISSSSRNVGQFASCYAQMFINPRRTFTSPPSLRKSGFDSLLESFEEFWESEAPRVGEPTARGWDAWVSSGNKQGTIPASPPVPSVTLELDPYRQWAANERIAE